ncbi:hypothetical protein AKJ16_DCAP14872 [Drosera capensis]
MLVLQSWRQAECVYPPRQPPTHPISIDTRFLASMASLGFRPPQFSDDAAWLPAWLQPHVAGMDDEEEKRERLSEDDCRATWDRVLKDAAPLEGENRTEDPNILSNRGSGWYCDHLLLSGDSYSAACCSSISSRKMCQFDLHLSTDGISSAISNLLMGISQADREKLNPPIQPVNSSVGLIEARQSNIDHGLPGPGLSRSASKYRTTNNIAHATFDSATSVELRKEQNINKEDSHDSEIDDAVELSVVASEALVIHELLKSELYTEISPGTAIVELSLRLKKARVEGLDKSCATGESASCDVLSDLDGSSMEEAYSDVGLSIDISHDIFVNDSAKSHTKGSPVPHSIPEEDKKIESEHKTTKDLPVYVRRDNQRMLCNKPSTDFICVPANHDSHHTNNFHPGKFDDTAFPQEGDALVRLRSKKAKSLPKALVVVTSNLSESAMDAPEENSAHIECSSVQKPLVGPFQHLLDSAGAATDEYSFVKDYDKCSQAPESKTQFADSIRMNNREPPVGENSELHKHHMLLSASGSHSGNPCGTKNGRPFICSEGSKDSSLSDIDPLCSIVPCSIGTQNTPPCENNMDRLLSSKKVRNKNFKNEAGNSPIPFHISGAVDEENQANSDIDPDTQPIVHSYLSSLKAYSAGFPSKKSCLEGGSPHVDLVNHKKHNPSVLSHEKLFGQTNLSSKDAIKQQPLVSYLNTSSSEKEGKFPTFAAKNPLEMMSSQRNTLTTATERGVQIIAPIEDNQLMPLVEPSRKKCQLQVPQPPAADVCTRGPEGNLELESNKKYTQRALFVNPHLQHITGADTPVPRKRVRFSEVDVSREKQRTFVGLPVAHEIGSMYGKRQGRLNQNQCMGSQELKDLLRNRHNKGKRRRLVFQGLEFLLTGFSLAKQNEIEGLLRIHGGIVLSDIPSMGPRRTTSLGSDSRQLPVILSSKKLQTTTFLYGCAVNAFILRVKWVTDSVKAGSVLLPDKYMILANQASRKRYRIGKSACRDGYIFDKVGIMVIGSDSFCSKMDKVIKHGDGCIFKSLQWMLQSLEKKKISLGVIVTDNQMSVSRHLRTCATELEIPILPATWITNSLYEGKLIPIIKGDPSPVQCVAGKITELPLLDDWSQEI